MMRVQEKRDRGLICLSFAGWCFLQLTQAAPSSEVVVLLLLRIRAAASFSRNSLRGPKPGKLRIR